VLQTIRRSEDEVVLIYGSPRKLCALAIGIARGVAKQFNETIEVTQTKCMHNDAPHCEIVFRKGMEVLITKTLRGMVAWTNWRNQAIALKTPGWGR
jgi:V4R domain